MPVLTPIACPQQTNSYDCGVYVLLFTRNIANLLHPNPRLLTTETITLSVANIQPTDCYEYRREILELTQRMINERKRKDSNHR